MTTFIIKKTDTHTLCEIADGTADTNHSSLVLFGKNYAGYGPQLDENLVKLMENFCFSSPPLHPLQGQLWWDSMSKTMKVYSQSGWKVVSGPSISTVPPEITGTQVGDLWWDQDNKQLKVFNGDEWIVVGPTYTAAQGVSGAATATVIGSSDHASHVIIKFIIGGIVVAVLSSDSTFTTNDVPGFPEIRPGFNLPTTYGQYVGDAENALKLGNVLAANYLRSDVISTTNFKLNVKSNDGLTVGLNTDLSIKVEDNAVKIENNILGRDTEFYVAGTTGVPALALRIATGTGDVLVFNTPTSGLAATNKAYVDSAISTASTGYLLTNGGNYVAGDIVPAATNLHSLGTNSNRFKNIFATNFIGDTITVGSGIFGSITITGGSTGPDSVVTKGYVDNADAAVTLATDGKLVILRDQLIGTATSNMNTLGKISAALGGNPTFATDLSAQLALLAPINNPSFTGAPMVPTLPSGDISNKIASSAFVSSVVSNAATTITNMVEANFAPLASPMLTGFPTAPTQTSTDASTKLATTEFVKGAIDALIGGAPGTLDTLNELAQAISDDANFSATFTAALALKAPIANPVLTGTPEAPTPVQSDSSTKIATTAFVTDKVNTFVTILGDQITNNTAGLALKANIASPALTGAPTAPTPAVGDASTKLATTAFVNTSITNLNADNAINFSFKANIASPALTGNPTAPTQITSDTSTRIATTAYVANKIAASVINPTFSGNVTVDNITINQGVFTPINNTVDIGTSLRNFRTIYGTAMKANYADLAENYVADANYAPGTVLDFGGDKEVTLSTGKDLTKVAGVVSTNPAYLMNSDCKGEFVVAVALQGRVPCRVIGQIAKGDLLVSYGDGIARRHLKPDAGTIIGKALEVHAGEESMIEIVVGRC